MRQDHFVNLLRSSLETPRNEVILSLQGLTHVDTMGISALVRVPIECAKRSIGLKVVLPSGVAGLALESIRIFHAWPNFSDEASALPATP